MAIIEFLVRNILHFMPVLFGFLFLGPLITQIIIKLDWVIPFDLTPITLGFIIGGAWGIFAFFRGSWIWARP